MVLGSQTCIYRLDPSTDPKLRNIWEKTKLSDNIAIRVITNLPRIQFIPDKARPAPLPETNCQDIRRASNVAKIEKFVRHNIDERPFPKLEELVGEKYYTDECKQNTRFFKFDRKARGLRPTASHLACFTGNVPSVEEAN